MDAPNFVVILGGIFEWVVMFLMAVWDGWWSIVDTFWPLAIVILILMVVVLFWVGNLVINSTWTGTMMIIYLGIGVVLLIVAYLLWTEVGVAQDIVGFFMGIFTS